MVTSPSSSEPSPQAWRSLRAVLTVQTQNAFNDNVVRFTLMGIAFIILQDNKTALESYKNIIGTLISLPFVLFAPIAGWTSDRFAKSQVIKVCLYAQIAIIVAIMGAVVIGNLWLATGGFFALAIQSAFFGPAKLGILKELVGSKKLAVVSGWMQMLAIVAIVFGSPAGGGGYKAARGWINDPWMAGLIPIGFILLFAVIALLIVRKIQPTPAHHQEKLRAGIFFRHFADLAEVYRSRPVWLSSLGIAFFWFSGAFAIAVFTQIAQEHFQGDTANAVASYCLAATGLGIMVGSIFVAIISSNRLELGLVPLGGLGMAVSVFLATCFPPGMTFYLSLGLLGITSAIFLVPQNAFLQDKADPKRRGRILSASNLINSLAAILANVAQYGFQRSGLSSQAQLWFLGIACLIAAIYTLKLLPSNFVRILLKMALRFAYRLRILGESNIPDSGGALLLANHVTWIDGLLIGAASPRDVRFVAHEEYFKSGFIGWILRLFNIIPISSKSARQSIKTTAEAIKGGSLVCVFPEGTLTRTGNLNELQKGFELIARHSDSAPVVPVYLDSLWGSIFSYAENKFFFKRPRKFPYHATVNFGAPISATEAKRDHVRDAMLGLSLEAYQHRPELRTTLDNACIDALTKKSRSVCFVDRSEVRRTRFTRRMVLASSLQLAERWRESIPEQRVAIALPPSTPSVLAHLGLIFAGKTIISLPLQIKATERERLTNALESGDIDTVITTKAIHEGLPDLPWPKRVIHLTEELRAVDGLPRIQARMRVALSPRWWLKRRLRLAPDREEEPVLGVLTTNNGYHFITHREMITQVAQIGDANAFQGDDVLLNLYPQHQLAGQLFGLWLPLLRHQRFVVHTMGSHPATAESLINKEQVTSIITGTDGLSFCEEALGKEDNVVRMIVTVDPPRKDDAFAKVAERHPKAIICHGLISKGQTALLTLSVPHPTASGTDQTGNKELSTGRILPGMLITCTGTPDLPASLLVQRPGSNQEAPTPCGAEGHIDSEGYLFLHPS
ncbi:MAG: acyl-[acyl-carrier-protein]-phospholipid O-acyltransferase [Verrucomicrobiales bacterium]|jgi:acyl-[acyl-carrier-protein]-phospholipid O-acyltransferase/long-chain-fatty-acid--[acyl-carrier-protein] ligase